MQLTLYTDYSLRVLVYLSLKADHAATITEIADYYRISRNHLVKVVYNLAQLSYIKTTRGKGGGLKLAKSPEAIKIGEIVRKVEPNFDIVECFNEQNVVCKIEPICMLKSALNQAKQVFLKELDKYTVADAVKKKTTIEFPIHFAEKH